VECTVIRLSYFTGCSHTVWMHLGRGHSCTSYVHYTRHKPYLCTIGPSSHMDPSFWWLCCW